LYNVCLILTLVNINYFLSRIGMILIRICLLVVCYLFKELYGFPSRCCLYVVAWFDSNLTFCVDHLRIALRCVFVSLFRECKGAICFSYLQIKNFIFLPLIFHSNLSPVFQFNVFSCLPLLYFLPSLAGCKGNHLFRFSKSFLNFFKTFLFILLLPLLLSIVPLRRVGECKGVTFLFTTQACPFHFYCKSSNLLLMKLFIL